MIERDHTRRNFRLPVGLVAAVAGAMLLLGLMGGFTAAQLLTPPTNCPEGPEVCEAFGVFWQTWHLARDNFVDPAAADPAQMTAGAVQGMLDSLGDVGHTQFLTAEEAVRWQEALRGEFEGIGIYVDIREGQAVVVQPIEGSPAERAGLRAGDLIVEVDGEPTNGWSVQELSAQVRGPVGTSVRLTVLHEGEQTPVEIDVTRSKVEIPNVTWTLLPNEVAYIRLSSFSENAGADIIAALSEAQGQGAQALVLDLRNNPGGLVGEAVRVASQFLPEGTTVLFEENRAGERSAAKTSAGGVALDLPMVVLVNSGTASSAEILSGALQDASRATLVGTPTVGTGTVLTPYQLQGGAQLLLGTSEWLTPAGRQIRNEGIVPDIRVALADGAEALTPAEASRLSADTLLQSEDTQLVEALKQVKTER